MLCCKVFRIPDSSRCMKMISELKVKVAALTSELIEYKSVRGQLRIAEPDQENGDLRSKFRSYKDTISLHNLWLYFSRQRGKINSRIAGR